MVEIAKALSRKARVLIMDEPSAALTHREVESLYAQVDRLRAEGVALLFCSHRLDEVARLADRITVLRDGSVVGRAVRGEMTEDGMATAMVGRELSDIFPAKAASFGDELLRVDHLNVAGAVPVRDATLTLRHGEVLGIAGLVGSGRTELAMSIFGRSFGRDISGTVEIGGRPADVSTVNRAIGAGLSYVTEDRKTLGLILDEPIQRNVSLANLAGISARGVLSRGREKAVAEGYRRDLGIRTPSVLQQVVNLSGGNQQKVVLSKWLFTQPQVLILDEPTRGIDVGAKAEIYRLLGDLAAGGEAIIVISSELPEVLRLSHRIAVMCEGRLTGILPGGASQEAIMELATQREGAAA